MAVTQYIGARYVPKFYTASDNSNKWESGVVYDPLTIVTYLNQTYTSKIPVPASVGNPADNPTYWILTGSYNAQVAQIQADYDNVKNDIASLQDFHAPDYIFLGDSYANPSYGNWPAYLAEYLGLSTYYSGYADGGSLYAGTLLRNLQNFAATHTAEEINKIGHVVYLGGINDAHTDAAANNFAAVKSGLQDICNYVKTTFPNAVFMIGYIGQSKSNSSILHGRSWENIAEAMNIYSKCGEYDAVFLGNLEFVLHDYSLFRDDGIHPTLEGGMEIAKYAATAIRAGSCDIYRNQHFNNALDFGSYWDLTSGLDADISTINFLTPQFANYSIIFAQHNSIEYIQWKVRLAIIFTDAKTIAQNATLQLGKISFPYFQPKPGDMFPITGRARLADSSYIPIRAHLLFNTDQVYMRFDSFGDNWVTPTSVAVEQILLDPASWSVPTILC